MSWTDLLPNGLQLKEKLSKIPNSLPLAPTPFQIIARLSGMKLLKFQVPSHVKKQTQTPIFIVPSMINRYYVLDLLPGKSFIEHFINQGVEIYLLDWGMPQDEDNWLSFDQLIKHRFDYFIDKTIEDSHSSEVHLVGHCLGGTLSTIYASLHQEKIKSLMLLTAPLDFTHGGKIGVWARHEQFNVASLVRAHGNMPWWMMQSSFHMLKPLLWWHKTERLMKERSNKEFLKNFLALEVWSNDNVSFPGKCYETLINEFYRKNSLIKGELQVQGQSVNLKHFQRPVLNVAAEDDHIVLFNSTLQPYHLEKETQYQCFLVKGGHIGALLGSRAQQSLWPRINDWLLKQESTESLQ